MDNTATPQAATLANGRSSIQFSPSDRSDDLPPLLRLLRTQPALQVLVDIHRVRLVVDSSVILNDLRWHCTKRIVSGARTALLEAAHSKIVTLFAPRPVRVEVEAHFEEFAQEFNISVAGLNSAWSEYTRVIKWLEPRATRRTQHDVSKRTQRDPSDAPCVSLSIQIGAGVLTADPDYGSFGITYYSPMETGALRGHARAAVAELKLTISAAGALALSGAMLVGAIRVFRRLPPIVQVLGAVAVIGALRSERRPDWIGRVTDALGDIGREFWSALTNAKTKRREFPIGHMRSTTPKTLSDHVAVTLAEAEQPMTVAGLAASVIASGYATRSRSFPAAVQAVLRRDARFQKMKDGSWQLRA